MDNEKMNNLIKRFHNIIYAPDVPALYGQGLSDYEILVRVAKVINDNADTMTAWYEIAKELNDMLQDVDEVIKDNVERVIQLMYESGDFDDIFDEYVMKYLNEKPNNSELMFKRIYRQNFAIGDNNVYISNAGQIRPSKLSSGTYAFHNGEPYLVYGIIPDGIYADNRGHDNRGIIRVIHAETLHVVGQVNVGMYHMNSMDYNPYDGCLYVASCVGYSSVNDNTKLPIPYLYCVELDKIIGQNVGVTDMYNVGALQASNYKTYDLSQYIDGLTSVNNISYSTELKAHEIYAGTGTADIYRLTFTGENFDDVTVNVDKPVSAELQLALDMLYDDGNNFGRQTTSICGDYAYTVTYNPMLIIRSNLITQTIDYIYNIPRIADNGYYLVGESENVKVLPNGDLYLFADYDIFSGNYRQYRQTQIFKANVFKNEMYSIAAFQQMKRDPLVVYVNNSIASYNPTGQSDKPFNSIAEAVNFANNNDVADAITIRMQTSSNMFIQVATSKKVRITTATAEQGRIDALTHDINIGTDENPNYIYKAVIGGVVITGGNVVFDNVQIGTSLPKIRVPAKAYVYTYDSNATFNNVLIAKHSDYDINTEPGGDDRVMTAYSFTASSGIISGSSSGNWFTVEDTKAVDGARSWGDHTEGWTFIGGSVNTINAHGWASLSAGVYA